MESIGTYTVHGHAHTVASAHESSTRPVLIHDAKPGVVQRACWPRAAADQVTLDCGSWRRHVATAQRPSELGGDDGLLGVTLTQWASGFPTGATLLAPSGFVPADDWGTLQAQVRYWTQDPVDRVVPFIPTDQGMLRRGSRARFVDQLSALPEGPVALLFAAKGEGLQSSEVLDGLRWMVTQIERVWLVGVQPLVALDAIAHGAQRTYVGTNSTLRFPSPPGVNGFNKNAKDFVPGLLHPDLLEMRSPGVYADWYVTSHAPRCPVCGRSVDGYTPTPGSRLRVVDHNIHALSQALAALETDAEFSTPGPASAHHQRIGAALAHLPLSRVLPVSDYDRVLMNLLRLDRELFPVPDEVSAIL
jgi:hypothetical protein